MILPVHKLLPVFAFCLIAAMSLVGFAAFLCLYLGLIILA